MQASTVFSEVGGGVERWEAGRGAYQQVHLEAFAAVTHCDLPWALGTARAQKGRRRAEKEGRVRKEKKKRGSVRVFIVFSCD